MASPAYATYVDDEDIIEHTPSVIRLTRDLANAARTMGPKEARFLVDAYYTSQENRKRAANQVRAMTRGVVVELPEEGDEPAPTPEPHVLIDWLFNQSRILEGQIKRALDTYTTAHIMGSWMRQVVGIGPVISAGLLAHLEQPRPTVGKIYAFIGWAAADQKPWKTGELRPFNTQLKTICWHAGQSFMKLSNRDDCFYGKKYRERKAFEQMMSDTGQRVETAKEWLNRFHTSTPTYKCYAEGKLPPSQIDGRARRYAVKLFLSHMNEVWLIRTGQASPVPYPIGHLHHVDYISPPIPA
jgi:hypothetical protein